MGKPAFFDPLNKDVSSFRRHRHQQYRREKNSSGGISGHFTNITLETFRFFLFPKITSSLPDDTHRLPKLTRRWICSVPCTLFSTEIALKQQVGTKGDWFMEKRDHKSTVTPIK
ncbi:MAG TPA: hypothetical protein DCP92_20405 [Nitrospiraceae bacterium]|nr:hypothetical protein [Nitrospiraceae bacterium]